jgi:hypothetical protein
MGQYKTKDGKISKQANIYLNDEKKLREWGISKNLYRMPDIFEVLVIELEMWNKCKKIEEEQQEQELSNIDYNEKFWEGWENV